jgi:hypothetical protein
MFLLTALRGRSCQKYAHEYPGYSRALFEKVAQIRLSPNGKTLDARGTELVLGFFGLGS